jgi:hypothetical protein
MLGFLEKRDLAIVAAVLLQERMQWLVQVANEMREEFECLAPLLRFRSRVAQCDTSSRQGCNDAVSLIRIGLQSRFASYVTASSGISTKCQL